MYKIGEVSKITGIPRKTLQEYNDLGLVKPTATNRARNWLYDKDAFKKIFIIHILMEAGYTPERIKHLLESSETDLAGEFDNVVALLEEKKKRIDEMIVTVRNIQQELKFSDITPDHLANMDPEQRTEARSWLSAIRGTITIPEQ